MFFFRRGRHVLLFLAISCLLSCKGSSSTNGRIAPLLEGMGNHHFPITTTVDLAQRFFNQGIVLAFGFNHKEAGRSFREAARLDSNCAMAYWGMALVLGPNINATMDPENNPAAYEALQKAMQLAPKPTEKEQAYIQALAKRYQADPPKDRGPLDIAYADAMRELHQRYPDDREAATLFAESLMDLHPWDYWQSDGKAKSWTPELLEVLESVMAGKSTSAKVDTAMMRQPGFGTLQHFFIIPLYAYVRFGEWDTILAEPKPAKDLVYPTGVWHYARGIAFARTNRFAEAEKELAAVKKIAKNPVLKEVTIWDITATEKLMEIAAKALAGELAAAKGDYSYAIEYLKEAIEIEDGLAYNEPPDWFFPVRHSLGAVFLEAGRPADAEQVYRTDLEIFPENGWSLYGLRKSLEMQDKNGEAAEVEQRFKEAWAWSDIELAASRF